MAETLTIVKGPKGRKGRSFSATLVGYLQARGVVDLGASDALRPVWIAFAGSESEVRAFGANFRAGRKAKRSGIGADLEVRKSDPYRWEQTPVPGGLVIVGLLPQLFELEPQGAREGACFVFAPPRWWVEEQAERLRADFGEEAREAARAALFAAYLDRRTHLPIVHDLGFHLRLYRRALGTGWLHEAEDSPWGLEVFGAHGMEAAGLDAPLLCSVAEAELQAFLTGETALHFEEEIRRGKTRIPAGGRLLPFPRTAPRQLRLQFGVAL